MKGLSILFLILVTMAKSLNAQNTLLAESYTQEVMENVAGEYSTCVAYFYLAKEAVEKTAGSSETSNLYKTAAENAMGYAYMVLIESGKSDEMAQQAVTSMVDAAVDAITEEMSRDRGNVNDIFSEYKSRCAKVMSDPEWLLQYWTDAIGQKYGIVPISKDDAREVKSKYRDLVNGPVYRDYLVKVAIEKGSSKEASQMYADCMVNGGIKLLDETEDRDLGKYMSSDGMARLEQDVAPSCADILEVMGQ